MLFNAVSALTNQRRARQVLGRLSLLMKKFIRQDNKLHFWHFRQKKLNCGNIDRHDLLMVNWCIGKCTEVGLLWTFGDTKTKSDSIQDDLRPISLLPTVGKVLEGIVKDWLIPSLDPGRKPVGCRRGRSTTHALIAVQHKWMEILDDRGSVRALFVDFRKAFDIINHNVLFSWSCV